MPSEHDELDEFKNLELPPAEWEKKPEEKHLSPSDIKRREQRKANKDAETTPLDMLYPYQREIVEYNARFKLLNCARQCGKSTVFAFESAMRSVLKPNDRWIALSRGERQVKEWVQKALHWTKIWRDYLYAVRGEWIEITASQSEIALSNGSKITGLPANPSTARGYSANVILDEFAYHDHPSEIWASVFPAITNGINGEFLLRVGSTVAGRSNKFWELFAQKNSQFKKWRVTIDDAIADGLPIKKEELQQAIADDDIWRQEYLCEPVEGTTSLLPLELIRGAQDDDATWDIYQYNASGLDVLDKLGRRFFVGVDIGRKHDLTVIWVVELRGDVAVTCAIREMLHVPFREQEFEIEGYIRGRAVKRVCIDATGIGANLAENLFLKYPAKVEQCAFSMQFKQELYSKLQSDFQNGIVRIPRDKAGRPVLEEDLHSLQRVFTSGGNLLYYAPTNADGHADRASALALAMRAFRTDSSHNFASFVPKSKQQLEEEAEQTYYRVESPEGRAWDVPLLGVPRYIDI